MKNLIKNLINQGLDRVEIPYYVINQGYSANLVEIRCAIEETWEEYKEEELEMLYQELEENN